MREAYAKELRMMVHECDVIMHAAVSFKPAADPDAFYRDAPAKGQHLHGLAREAFFTGCDVMVKESDAIYKRK